MKRDFTTTLEGIEHDHTRLDVLFEDLGATTRQGLQERDNPVLLEDARALWQDLHDEILSHLAGEERRLFAMLLQEHPSLAPDLQMLSGQHVLMRRQLQGIRDALHSEAGSASVTSASVTNASVTSASFEILWGELAGLWADHSAREWALLSRIRENSENSFQDGQA